MNRYRRTTRKLDLERDGVWHFEEEFVPMHEYGFKNEEEVQIEISSASSPTREELILALDRVCNYEDWDVGFNMLQRIAEEPNR